MDEGVRLRVAADRTGEGDAADVAVDLTRGAGTTVVGGPDKWTCSSEGEAEGTAAVGEIARGTHWLIANAERAKITGVETDLFPRL